MPPKITKGMASAAVRDGAKVKELRKLPQPQRPKPESKPIPTAQTDLTPLTGAIGELVSSLKEQAEVTQGQLQEAQRQNKELSAMVKVLSAEKPLRLKPIRDMEKGSPTYLLVTHYDFVPVTYSRKLN